MQAASSRRYSLGDADLLRRAMGKKIRSEMQKQSSIFVEGCVARGIGKAQAEAIFEIARTLRRLRLQQEPRGGLRAGRLPDRLYEGRIIRSSSSAASMTLDMGNNRQAVGIPRGSRTHRHQGRSAVDQPLRCRLRSRWQYDHLRARRAERCRPRSGQVDHRRARPTGPFADLADFSARINPRAVNKRVLESLVQARRVRWPSTRTAPAVLGAVDTIMGRASTRMRRRRSGRSELFGGGGQRETIALRKSSRGCRRKNCARNTRRSASSCRAIRSTTYTAVLKKLRGAVLGRVLGAAVKNGAHRRQGRAAPWCRGRSAAPRPATRWAFSACPIPTGHYER